MILFSANPNHNRCDLAHPGGNDLIDWNDLKQFFPSRCTSLCAHVNSKHKVRLYHALILGRCVARNPLWPGDDLWKFQGGMKCPLAWLLHWSSNHPRLINSPKVKELWWEPRHVPKLGDDDDDDDDDDGGGDNDDYSGRILHHVLRGFGSNRCPMVSLLFRRHRYHHHHHHIYHH